MVLPKHLLLSEHVDFHRRLLFVLHTMWCFRLLSLTALVLLLSRYHQLELCTTITLCPLPLAEPPLHSGNS